MRYISGCRWKLSDSLSQPQHWPFRNNSSFFRNEDKEKECKSSRLGGFWSSLFTSLNPTAGRQKTAAFWEKPQVATRLIQKNVQTNRDGRVRPQLDQIGRKFDFLRWVFSTVWFGELKSNEKKRILNSPRFNPFGANHTRFWTNSCIIGMNCSMLVCQCQSVSQGHIQ